jgi:hypothetical protein
LIISKHSFCAIFSVPLGPNFAKALHRNSLTTWMAKAGGDDTAAEGKDDTAAEVDEETLP